MGSHRRWLQIVQVSTRVYVVLDVCAAFTDRAVIETEERCVFRALEGGEARVARALRWPKTVLTVAHLGVIKVGSKEGIDAVIHAIVENLRHAITIIILRNLTGILLQKVSILGLLDKLFYLSWILDHVVHLRQEV